MDDLDQYVTSEVDFYDLLGVSSGCTQKEIERAYRLKSLKYHPDKNPGNLEVIEKFHLITIAKELLTAEDVRGKYDAARTAREAKRRQKELFEGRRRTMAEELERREGGVKRKRDDFDETELARLAEDGRKRRLEKELKMRREAEAEEHIRTSNPAQPVQTPQKQETPSSTSTSGLERSVRVRWQKDDGDTIDEARLSSIFEGYGKLEGIIIKGKAKDTKKSHRSSKKPVTAFVIFETVTGADAAIAGGDKLKKSGLEVSKADKAEPSPPTAADEPRSSPSINHQSSPGTTSQPSTPVPAWKQFTSREEAMMMRLKLAEKKRLEAKIREAEAADQLPEVLA